MDKKMTDSIVPEPPEKSRLAAESYGSSQPLTTRIEIHRKYSVPNIDLPVWILDRHPWRGDERVLDIGTGTGQYLELLRPRIPHGFALGGDLSLAMLRAIRAGNGGADCLLINADAEQLPLTAHSMDAVIASYMLFFVPDIDRAISEAHRILKRGGVLLAVTMADLYLDEIRRAIDEALKALGSSRPTQWGSLHRRFTIENGRDQLARHFDRVELYRHDASLVFPEPTPVLAFINTMRNTLAADLPPESTWEEFTAALDDNLRGKIREQGRFVAAKSVGVFAASNSA
jgi:SAM-dependent methyltransferase